MKYGRSHRRMTRSWRSGGRYRRADPRRRRLPDRLAGFWLVVVGAQEFFRRDTLGRELRERVQRAMELVPGATAVAGNNNETWRATGSPSGEALVRPSRERRRRSWPAAQARFSCATTAHPTPVPTRTFIRGWTTEGRWRHHGSCPGASARRGDPRTRPRGPAGSAPAARPG